MSSNAVTAISLREAMEKVPHKKQMYISLRNAGYLLPEPKATVNTVDFVAAVHQERCYCPHLNERLLATCQFPPTYEVLRDEVARLTSKMRDGLTKKKYEHLIFFLHGKRANPDWMLLVIKSLDPNHAYFQKSYRPPKPQNSMATAMNIQISNAGNFFDNATMLKKRVKRANMNLFISKEDQIKYKKECLLAKREALLTQLSKTDELIVETEEKASKPFKVMMSPA
jgi:hypothetical protein